MVTSIETFSDYPGSLVGHSQVIRTLVHAQCNERLSHSLLFSGPKGIGKATVARHLSWAYCSGLFDHADVEGDICKQIEAVTMDDPVLARMINGNDPDLFILSPAVNAKTGVIESDIKVEAIRKLKQFLTLTSMQSRVRCVIVDSIDDLNVNASNAFLKLLEEPPEQTVFFLVSHVPTKLLPTILSRAIECPFKPLSDDQTQQVLASVLRGSDYDDYHNLIPLSFGSPGRVIEFLQRGGVSMCQALADLLISWPNIDMNKTHQFVDQFLDKSTPHTLHTVMYLLHIYLYYVINAAVLPGTERHDSFEHQLSQNRALVNRYQDLVTLCLAYAADAQSVQLSHMDKRVAFVNAMERIRYV